MSKTPEQLAQFEADRTFLRTIELDQRPIGGNFDRAHLQKIHEHLFQDLPHFQPGQLRTPTPPGGDWVKYRTIGAHRLIVAYSSLDQPSVANLDAVLTKSTPKLFKGLPPEKVPEAMAELYATVDYAHPFNDGNSRTLRVFTRQLAKESGYTLDWEKLSQGENAQTGLYIARDLAVNKIALPHIRTNSNQRDAQYALDLLERFSPLSALMAKAIQPQQGVAKESVMPALNVRGPSVNPKKSSPDAER